MILFDLPVYQFIMNVFEPTLLTTFIMRLFSTLASPIVIITAILCVAVIVKDKKYFKIFFLVNLCGLILNNIVKILVHRPRPVNTMLMSVETSYSFPSSHAMMSVVFYGLLIYYILKFVNKKKLRFFLVSFISAVVVFIGISRIYLGVHYATDVLAGYILGLIYLILTIKFFISKNDTKNNTKVKNTVKTKSLHKTKNTK